MYLYTHSIVVVYYTYVSILIFISNRRRSGVVRNFYLCVSIWATFVPLLLFKSFALWHTLSNQKPSEMKLYWLYNSKLKFHRDPPTCCSKWNFSFKSSFLTWSCYGSKSLHNILNLVKLIERELVEKQCLMIEFEKFPF